MTHESPSTPHEPSDGAAPGTGGPGESGAPEPPPKRRVRRSRRALRWTALALVLAIVLIAAALYGAVATEPGTRLVWRTAVAATGSRLTGRFVGGTLAHGVRLANVRWLDRAGAAGAPPTDIRIDRIEGRWALTRSPWRLTVDALEAGTIDARLAPSTSTAPMRLPSELRLPIQLEVRTLALGKLILRDGASATEIDRLHARASSDGVHHTLSIDGLDTSYGALAARLSLGGQRPFPLTGALNASGAPDGTQVTLDARLSGTLEALAADVAASGMKLSGRAHIEAQPFAPVPLTRATIAFDHVDPRVLDPGAPQADLSLAATLAPVPGGGPLVVAGPVAIVNAKPGLLEEHRLPLVRAGADLRLSAREQRLDHLTVQLVRHATLTGSGTFAGGRGQLALDARALDLTTLTPYVRQTALSGPIRVTLDGPAQSLSLDLADEAARLRARARVALEHGRIALHDVRIDAGDGRLELKGALAPGASAPGALSSYDLGAVLTNFDPRLVIAAELPGVHSAAAGSAKSARAGGKPPGARVTGRLSAVGTLGEPFSTKLKFELGDSVYDGFPLTGEGTVQLAGARLLPSNATLSIAGNDVELHGSFGGPGDRLRFHVDAPQLDRLGFGIAGTVLADGDLTGSLAHPDVTLRYDARAVAIGANRIGAATGSARIRDGATGALEFTTDARDVHAGPVDLTTLSAHVTGTRGKHAFDAQAKGSVGARPIDMALAGTGALTDTRAGPRWDGMLARLTNRGLPGVELQAPVAVSAGGERVTLGPTRLAIEGATLDLKSIVYDHGAISSAGSASNLSVARFIAIRQTLTGQPSRLSSDLVFAADWDFTLGRTASGYARIERRSGDATLSTGYGTASFGITALSARVDLSAARVAATVRAAANRVGTLDANVSAGLSPDPARGGLLGLTDEAPLAGRLAFDIPALKATGGLFGPSYVLDGHLALNLVVAGTRAKPAISGALVGDDLSATLVDQGIQLKDGIVRVALTENLVDLQRVEFHGGDGTIRATGRIRLDSAEPDLTARIVADKLELFAAPDRQLSLSGSATVANGGPAGGLDINGKFTVDHALFDLPEQSAPRLSDDVVIVRDHGFVRGSPQPVEPTNKPVGRFAPRASVDIDLGSDFRFRGQGADLGLRGTVTALSAPDQPLRAIGNVRVTEGSTYTTFGRKLAIENGYFTFNGPVANPGVNILAMRRNQEVEAGVQVTGTVRAPIVKLVSEPNVTDNEKLSWLLFGHGTDQGNNLSQQSSMTTALALLGSATGKRVAQTFGLDEFSVGRSDVGLTDSQVVALSKAINDRLVLGYEQGLQSASNAFKATVNLSRFWSVLVYTGTFQGMDVNYTRRFDRWRR
ncbi:translocation/assembly module TamB domain-containing protein [Trinickia diaoshuihuensis]|uniref:translocation/assembly module TamB domain-containing protein n=1 Tax=Trinickia diaoshuihuensis TaxID=2292265 RepID=UPI000E21EE7C|nr:translocation/assembly module TamB domain-containing protein [Trinickia diaoshuihuensis]